MSERLHVVTNANRLKPKKRGLIVEAHRDDASMSVIDVPLAKSGVGITLLTLTDGAARGLDHMTPDQIRIERIIEGSISARTSGAADIYFADLPDGKLAHFKDQSREIISIVAEEKKPDFVIVTNLRDPHTDHAEAAKAAIDVFGGTTPLYLMDTIAGTDSERNPLPYTHIIPISRKADRRRKRAHMDNKTQVERIPREDLRHVNKVLLMPQNVASRLNRPDVQFAGAIELVNPSQGDPVGKIFEQTIYVNELAVVA